MILTGFLGGKKTKMIEIGSFIGLDLAETGEFYNNDFNTARLNSGRAGIYHACRLYNCKSVYIPYYLCPTVKDFLTKKGINIKPYNINNDFEPVGVKQKKDHAMVIVNYFGILSHSKMLHIANRFNNVIIDNSAAFFSEPLDDCYNVYSARKFFGVPDGCYVVGKNSIKYTNEYDQDQSSETSSFLLKTIEFGTNFTYKERMKNEERIDNSGILRMSEFTKRLLKSVDYEKVMHKRQENFMFAHMLFSKINLLDVMKYHDGSCVPMAYPLVVKDPHLDKHLRDKNIYVGRLWKYVLKEVPSDSFEAWLSRYMVPLPIDQRYGKQELKYIYSVVKDVLG